MYNLVWNHVRVFKMERVRSANDEQHKNEFRSKMHDTKLQLPIHHISILKQISSSKPILLNLTNQHKRRYVIITFSTFFSLLSYTFLFCIIHSLFIIYKLHVISYFVYCLSTVKIFSTVSHITFLFPNKYSPHAYVKISL